MAFIFGNISPKNFPIFWDGMKYYYKQGVNASRINTSKLTDFSQFFRNSTMTVAPWFDTHSMTRADNIFVTCSSLVTVPNPIFASLCGNWTNAFSSCNALSEIRFAGQIIASISFSNSANLTGDSLLSIAYALDNSANTLSLNNTMSSFLTQNVKDADGGLAFCDPADPDTLGTLAQYITDKGWTVTIL